MDLDPHRCYRALRSRDRRFDGRFFVAVRTTRIYCRPICPAPTPHFRNTTFYPCAAAAEAAGFRACLRCRPETAPGTPAWEGTSAVVSRALRLIRAGAVTDDDLDGLAERLGVGERQLRRLFAKHLGVAPGAVARAQRLHDARVLLAETSLPVGEIAFAAGFRSLRQFNHAVRASFGDSPTGLRRRASRRAVARGDGIYEMRLAYRPPFAWSSLLGFLAARAIPGVESVDGERYRRAVGEASFVEVEHLPAAACVVLRVHGAECSSLLPYAARARRLFDLDADPLPIAVQLGRSATLAECVRRAPGLRVPGAWDPFEIAVRAVLGQQVSVAAATTLAGRLARRFGRPVDVGPELTHLFPTAEALAAADVAAIGLPKARAEAIRTLAAAIAGGALVLDGACDLEESVRRMSALPGMGEWTAQYVAMRALGEPDAFPAGDLGLRRALGNGAGPLPASELTRLAEEWRPWRAYAALHLWSAGSAASDDGGTR